MQSNLTFAPQAFLFVVTVGFCGLSSPAVANRNVQPTAYTGNAACIMDHSDPYDPGLAMPFGADIGKCADTHEERAPYILSENNESITIANFRHARRWWIAKIPKSGVQNVIFQLAQFTGWQGAVGAAHGQIRFLMAQDHPVILREQRIGHAETVVAMSDFLISAESFNAKDADAGMGGSLNGQMGIVSRVVSMAERAMDELVKDGRNKKVIQTNLLLNQAQRNHLLLAGIKRSAGVGYTEVYDYLQHNCVVVALETLDDAFPSPTPMAGAGVGVKALVTLDTIIGPARRALAQRHLIDPNDNYLLDNESAQGQFYLRSMIGLVEDPAELAVLKSKLK